MGLSELCRKWSNFTKREFEEPKQNKDQTWIFRELGRNALTLSGFSFASMFFAFSYYKDTLSSGAFPISGLTLCAILFLLSSEIAREAWEIWRYLIAETLYLFTIFVLMWILLIVIWNSGIISFPWWEGLVVLTGVFLLKGFHSVYVTIDLCFKPSKNQDSTYSCPNS